MRGANFETMVPGTMMTSACRGDARGTPAWNRSRSCLTEYVCIISMLQHAIPNCSMNMLDPRTQFMNLSNLVRMKGVEPNASRSRELNRLSTPSPMRASRVDVSGSLVPVILSLGWSLLMCGPPFVCRGPHPLDDALAPGPGEADDEDADEDEHRREHLDEADAFHR